MRLKTSLPLGLLLTALVGLSSCFPKLDDTEQVITWDHFATGFVEKPVLYAATDLNSDMILLYSFMRYEEEGVVSISKEEQRPRVSEYASRFGDKLDTPVTYRGLVRNGGAVIPANFFYATPISSIEISSSIAWGEEYPAGSSLNSLFAYFTGCADQFAKTHQPYEKKSIPATLPVVYGKYRTALENFSQYQSGTKEILYGMLSDLDLTHKDYVGINQLFMALATDRPEIRLPQKLTIKATFRDGQTATAELPLETI